MNIRITTPIEEVGTRYLAPGDRIELFDQRGALVTVVYEETGIHIAFQRWDELTLTENPGEEKRERF